MQTGDETRAIQVPREAGAVDDLPGHKRGGQEVHGLPSGRLTRLAVNLGPEAADVLKDYAARKGVSVTEAVRRAIAVLAFVDETQRRGAAINVEENGVIKEVMFMA